ncbi:MAG TPA: serine hydrolase [Lacunisphaera sp.]|nr:serine hydrolase [Lacunisphaera sp.]
MIAFRRLAWVLALVVAPLLATAASYFPPAGDWARVSAENAGMDPAKLQQAVAFSVAHESTHPKDMALDLRQTFGARESRWKLLGPTQPRGALAGIVIRHGYVVAAWGEPDRVDMTHSVSKTFLSTVVGLAFDRGLIRSLSDPARDYVPGTDLFSAEHNRSITWEHLLRQTSDWSGTLWDIPDWADRPIGTTEAEQEHRPMHAPGSYFKYNDVRVNLLALVTLHAWRRPLPEVLRDEIMNPIGASASWHWEGYENSWVELDGRRMQSVSGGGHFGGGMFINAWDMARFGYLFLRQGRWDGRQLISEKWIALARTPGPANAEYGFCNWFLNTGRKAWSAAPASAVIFEGNGTNLIYLDWDHDLLVVVRWIDGKAINEFLGDVLGAITDQPR